jgi:hypothetical protein
MDNTNDMYFKAATATFMERKRLKGNKFYGEYAVEETLAISSEDENDMKLAKQYRSDPPSHTTFDGMVRVNPKSSLYKRLMRRC